MPTTLRITFFTWSCTCIAHYSSCVPAYLSRK